MQRELALEFRLKPHEPKPMTGAPISSTGEAIRSEGPQASMTTRSILCFLKIVSN